MIDFLSLFSDERISICSSGRHKRAGYTNVVCPYCTGHAGYHRGFSHVTGSTICYRCKKTSNSAMAISDILKISYGQAKTLLKKYTTGFIETDFIQFEGVEEVNVSGLGLRPLTNEHWNYLDDRGYDVQDLIDNFKLMSTGWKTDPFWQKNKIYIPYFFNRELVFYTCRDIHVGTKQEGGKAKYTAINKDKCKMIDKKILYNFDRVRHRDSILCFEGNPDVWRFPDHAVGLSGVKFLAAQCLLLTKTFKRVIFILDPDSAGSEAAQRAFNEMECMQVNTEVYEITDLEKDPGDLTYTEADEIIKELKLQGV